MVNNNCYTRDSERDISELASNLEQVLTFGLVEAVIDFLALVFDGCSLYLGGLEESKGIIAFVIHCVGIFFDIIISAVNFFAFVIPAFDVYNQQNDFESRCYSFEHDTNDNIDTYTTTTSPTTSPTTNPTTNPTANPTTNPTTIPTTSTTSTNNEDDLLWQEITMIVFACLAGCGCLFVCFGAVWIFLNDVWNNNNTVCFSFFCGITVCMGGGLLMVFLVEPWLVIAFIVIFVCGCGFFVKWYNE